MGLPGERALDIWDVQFPEREDITVAWLRETDDFGVPNAHLVLHHGYMNLPARGLLKHVIDLVDENGDTTMHHVCGCSEAFKATPQEFLTPKLLLAENSRGLTPLQQQNISLVPWHRFPRAQWVEHIETVYGLGKWHVNQPHELWNFVGQLRALRKLKSTEEINVEEVA